jgi:hypothetical protein
MTWLVVFQVAADGWNWVSSVAQAASCISSHAEYGLQSYAADYLGWLGDGLNCEHASFRSSPLLVGWRSQTARDSPDIQCSLRMQYLACCTWIRARGALCQHAYLHITDHGRLEMCLVSCPNMIMITFTLTLSLCYSLLLAIRVNGAGVL